MSVVISLLEWFLSKLPSYFSRWYWTEEKLTKGMVFDFRPRHSQCEVWFSDGGHINFYFNIENRNRVPVVVDRILADFSISPLNKLDNIHHFKRIKLSPDQKIGIRLEAPLNPFQLRKLYQAFEQDKKMDQGRLHFTLEVDSDVRSFTVENILEGINNIEAINKPDAIEKLGLS